MKRESPGPSVVSPALVIDLKGTLSTPGEELTFPCVVRFVRSNDHGPAGALSGLKQDRALDSGAIARLTDGATISLLLEASAAASLARHFPLRAGLSGRCGYACRLDIANRKLIPLRPVLEGGGNVTLGPVSVSRERNLMDGRAMYTLSVETLSVDCEALIWEVGGLRFTAPKVVVSNSLSFRPDAIRWTERAPRAAGPPKLFYFGLLLLLAVQIARASQWSIPLFPSYGVAFAIAFAVAALGAADAIYVRQNAVAATGVLISATGIVGLGFDWTLFGTGTFMPVAVTGGVLFILGAIPGLLGVPTLILGTFTLAGAVIGAATGGIQAVPPMVWATAVVLLGLGSLMMKRQKRLTDRGGAFVAKR